jgi:voltage-gated potassium channel Kch
MLATVERARWNRIVLVVAFAATLLLVLHASHVHRTMMRVALAGVSLSVLVVVLESVTDRDLFGGSTFLVLGLLLFISPFVILQRIFRHPEVSLATILGAICVYLLIGLVFAEIYLMLDDIETFFAQGERPPGDFLYFSFVTLTTTGYGDLTPGSRAAKAIVVYEAIAGQLFLAILIARLVTSFVGRRRKDPLTGGDADEDPAADATG